jgi:hypothetical protein
LDDIKGYETIVWKTLSGDPDGYTEYAVVGSAVTEELARLVSVHSEYWNGHMHKVVSGNPSSIKRRKG